MRLLSYSEIDTALTCWARWDMAYGGRLAGDCLEPKRLAPILSGGRAWGAAVAAYHAESSNLLGPWAGHVALKDSLHADGADAPLEERIQVEIRLSEMLDHYIASAGPLGNLSRLEEQLVEPLPSRTGQRRSGAYRFLCFIDGWTVDADGHAWLVEFKLRKQLTPLRQIVLGRQIRWYAWALEQHGIKPVGVIVDERLNEVPKPPRILKSGKPSHAKDQLTTPEWYSMVCQEHEEDVNLETLVALGQRTWQQRAKIMFRAGEIEEAGHDLVSAAKLIRDLDSGELSPIRHASKMNCNGCRFRDVCSDPQDRYFVDELFDRKPPKRDREPVAA